MIDERGVLRMLADNLAARARALGLVVRGVGVSLSGSCYVCIRRRREQGGLMVRLSTHKLSRKRRVRMWPWSWCQYVLWRSSADDWRALLRCIERLAQGGFHVLALEDESRGVRG